MKKSGLQNAVVSNEQSNQVAAAAVDPVPTNVPALPEGRVATTKVGRRGKRPRKGLIDAAPALLKELRANGDAIRAELGPKAADPAAVAASLATALAWHKAADDVATYSVYARGQRGQAWDASIAHLGGLHAGVRFAIQRDPSFAERFPSTAKAFAPLKRKKKSGATAAAAKPRTAKAAPPAPEPALAAEPAPAEPAPPPPTA
jgi:hypothetical protein